MDEKRPRHDHEPARKLPQRHSLQHTSTHPRHRRLHGRQALARPNARKNAAPHLWKADDASAESEPACRVAEMGNQHRRQVSPEELRRDYSAIEEHCELFVVS